MPAAAPILLAGGMFGGMIVGGGAGLAIGVTAALGAGVVMYATRSSSTKTGVNQPIDDRGHQINTTSSRRPLPLLYGITQVGCNQTFKHSKNPHLHLICELGEGEINGLVREDGSLYDTTATALPTSNPPQVYLDDKLFSEYSSDLVHIEFFNGSAAQSVCSTLQTATAKWDQALRYTAYLYVRLKYYRDKFKSLPEVTALIQGLKIYDPVTTSTAYTANAALCAYDFLTRSSQRGGLGVAAARIDTTSISDAKDYCSAKGWTANMPVTERQADADNLRLILNNMRGDIVFSDDTFKLKYLDLNYESTVMALDQDDVVATGNSSLKISQPDVMDRPNAVRLTHLSAEKKYKADDFVKSDLTAIAAEGDYREIEVKTYGLSDPALVQGMASYHLERARWNKTVDFVAGSRALALEPLDLITLEHDLPGWSAKTLRVLTAAINPDHTVVLSCIEEQAGLYDDTYNLTAHDWDDTDLPDPTDAPPQVTGVSAAEDVYYYRGRSFTRWEIDFAGPADTVYPWWDYAEIWLKIGAGEWRYMTKSENNYVLDPVQEGEAYQLKMRSVSSWGVKEDFDSAYTVAETIVGKTAAPSSLVALTAIANGDSVSIYSDPVDDPDIEGYEIRLGSAWAGAIFVSFNKNISLRLNGVRPGSHTFWAAARNNAGDYSNTPRSANVTVYIPPGYAELATYGSWAWDFTSGTYDNTEHETYDSEDALKCSHTAGVLTGTWTSPTHDLNAISKVRVWGDFRQTFVSSATIWTALGASGTTWATAISGSPTWQEIFEPLAAPRLRVTLLHKESSGDSWSEIDFFEILMAEVEARYIAVLVTITDPVDGANLHLRELNMWAYTGPQEVS